MSVMSDLERILREAKAQARGLERPGTDVLDMVLIEVAASHLETALTVIQAAASGEGADHDAPEEPPASAH